MVRLVTVMRVCSPNPVKECSIWTLPTQLLVPETSPAGGYATMDQTEIQLLLNFLSSSLPGEVTGLRTLSIEE